jgi:hypothetical protein
MAGEAGLARENRVEWPGAAATAVAGGEVARLSGVEAAPAPAPAAQPPAAQPPAAQPPAAQPPASKEQGRPAVAVGDSAATRERWASGSLLDDVRRAAWLSIVCAVTAAVVAVPAACAEFFLNDAAWRTFGPGVEFSSSFNDPAPMLRHEPYGLNVDRSTPGRRGAYLLGGGLQQLIVLGFFPFNYAIYLGFSSRVRALTSLSVLSTCLVIVVGFVICGYEAFFKYSPLFTFFVLYLVVRRLCPHGSRVPHQVFKQALCLALGNLLAMNVIPERTVR